MDHVTFGGKVLISCTSWNLSVDSFEQLSLEQPLNMVAKTVPTSVVKSTDFGTRYRCSLNSAEMLAGNWHFFNWRTDWYWSRTFDNTSSHPSEVELSCLERIKSAQRQAH